MEAWATQSALGAASVSERVQDDIDGLSSASQAGSIGQLCARTRAGGDVLLPGDVQRVVPDLPSRGSPHQMMLIVAAHVPGRMDAFGFGDEMARLHVHQRLRRVAIDADLIDAEKMLSYGKAAQRLDHLLPK